MRKASALVLTGALFFIPGNCFGIPRAQANSQASPQKKKPIAKTAPKSASKANLLKTSASRKGGATTRLVRTKSGRLARVPVHTPPAPTFQTHPDQDRYVEIQKALADRGYFKGDPNGEWGDDSVDALRRFQGSLNLPDDGKISALTLSGLGLGPRHDGSTASTVPVPQNPAATSIVGSTTGPAASSPPSAPIEPPPNH